VAEACPVCKGCSLVDAGCVLQPVTTMAPAVPKVNGPPCQADCMFAGYTATCGSRILWTNANSFAGKPDSCTQAYKLVKTQCQQCAECTPINAGCAGEDEPQQSRRMPVHEFDCNAKPDEMKDWTVNRTKWCCKNKKIGCQDRIRVLRKFDGRLPRHATPQFATISGSSLPGSMGFVLFLACCCSLFVSLVVAVRCGYIPHGVRRHNALQYAKVPESAGLLD